MVFSAQNAKDEKIGSMGNGRKWSLPEAKCFLVNSKELVGIRASTNLRKFIGIRKKSDVHIL